MNKICVISLGCAKNLNDSEIMLSCLKKHGYEIVNSEDEAEIIVVNTCCFIDSAKQESIDTILEVAEQKKTGKLKLLIVSGCMGERFKQDVLNELPEVDAVCGTGDFADICSVIEKAEKKRGLYITDCYSAPMGKTDRVLATPPYTAYIKIAEGCSNNCTYCVIPSIRGKYRSRNIETIVDEANELADNGAKEIILIAQDTSSYGADLYGEYSLDRLLLELVKIDKIKWIRIHYLYPEHITDSLIDVVAKYDKILNYFDIPIQHCNDTILRKMARRTNKKEIVCLINKIRNKIPDAVFRTSLIAGFPGETEEAFYELVEFLKEEKLDYVGAFPYSQEDGTPAASFECQLEENVKNDRVQKITEVQYEIVCNLNEQKNGNVYSVLVENYDKILKMYYGRTYASSLDVDPKIFFKSDKKIKPGQFINIKVTDYIDCDLIGELCNEV